MELTKDLYFENLYRDSYRMVFNFARRLCGNYDQAEDLTQEAFIRAYVALDDQGTTTKVDSWLKKIVYNLFLDARRRESRRVKEVNETRLDEGGLDQFADTHVAIDVFLTQSVQDSPVMGIINSLDYRDRTLLKMAYVDQLSHDEIGEKLGVRPGTATSRIHRLCRQVRHMATTRGHGAEKFGSAVPA